MNSSRSSAAERQALDQRLGQAAGAHAFLNGFDIVWNAPELDGLLGEVSDYECSARVSIARLADGAGIEQVGGAIFDGQGGEMASGGGVEMQHADLIVAQSEAALQMRVTEESNLRRGVEQAVERLGRREHIFVFIAEGAVDHNETILVERAGRKLLEPFAIFGAELVASPQRNGARDGIEIVGVGDARAGFIVIAANGERANFADAIDHFVGIGAVADYVAETDYFVPMAFRGGEGGVESCEVGVNVAENQIAHATAPRGRMRIIDEEWIGCTKSRVGTLRSRRAIGWAGV